MSEDAQEDSGQSREESSGIFNLDGVPLLFYMPFCSEREFVKSIIELHGGKFDLDGLDPSAIRLLPEGAEKSRGASVNGGIKYYDFRFVVDSVEAKKLKKKEDYEVVPKLKARAKLPYSIREDKQLINYVIVTRRFKEIKGLKLYDDAVKARICPGRTQWSLRERMLKTIIPSITNYPIDQKYRQLFISNLNGTAARCGGDDDDPYLQFLEDQEKIEREQAAKERGESVKAQPSQGANNEDQDDSHGGSLDEDSGEQQLDSGSIQKENVNHANSDADEAGANSGVIVDDEIEIMIEPRQPECRKAKEATRRGFKKDRSASSDEAQHSDGGANHHDCSVSGVDTSSDHEDDVPFPRRTVKRKRRSPYSFEEDEKILKMIIRNKWYSQVKGVSIWMDMEESLSRTKRTWQSLKERYRRRIIPHLYRYSVNYDQAKNLIKSSELKLQEKNDILSKCRMLKKSSLSSPS